MKEIWKPIPNWETLYHASNKGRIKRLKRISDNPLPSGKIRKMHLAEKILSPCIHKQTGYHTTTFSVGGKETKVYIHRIICETFHGSQKKHQEARHLDGKRINNYPSNLCWGTSFDNAADMLAHGTVAKGEGHGMSKLSEEKVKHVKKRISQGHSLTQIAKDNNVDPSTISNIKTGRNWSWLN